MFPRLLAALALATMLAGCGGSGGSQVKSVSTPPPKPASRTLAVRPPVRKPPPPAQVQALPGLETVIGATAADLARQFGTARLDTWEGDARKLQFTGLACVLDVYLYPSAQGREPQATYVDARRASDGKEVDRIACISALRKP